MPSCRVRVVLTGVSLALHCIPRSTIFFILLHYPILVLLYLVRAMPRLHPARTASLLITLFGTLTNFVLTIQVLAAWRALRWEPDSEWEASGDKWRVDGIKIIWALLSAYFASAAAICAIGFTGIIKHKASYVRLYRDYSIADFSFCAFFTALATYGSFRTPARTGVCEEFSHHPELMRDVLEMGLNVENCERWLERAVFALLAFMFVIIVVRLHFLLAVSNYYSQLCLNKRTPLPLHRDQQRIYLLPTPAQSAATDVEMVYTPVPLSSLSKDVQLSAREAWVSQSPMAQQPHDQQASSAGRHHRHHHRTRSSRSSRASSADNQTGRIRLPIVPDEGLLPPYTEPAKA